MGKNEDADLLTGKANSSVEVVMSYPSVVSILEEQGIAVETATNEQIKNVLLEAFHRDLGSGMAYLNHAAASVKKTGRRFLRAEDPNSPVGKQLTRLLGADIARGIVEEHFAVAFGLYNCCGVTAASTREGLRMT